MAQVHKNSNASDLLPPPLVSNLASLKLQATGLHLWLLYCQHFHPHTIQGSRSLNFKLAILKF